MYNRGGCQISVLNHSKYYKDVVPLPLCLRGEPSQKFSEMIFEILAVLRGPCDGPTF